jgi:ATP-dependent DNA helicase RecQ
MRAGFDDGMMRGTLIPALDELRAGLGRHFGLSEFRAGQAEVITSVIGGRNVVVVMPTGAGKSLCYQLPAMLLPGLTLVVSPLIALMKDQVEQLAGRGIPATFINSTLTEVERSERLRLMRAGAYKLIYVAPERFRSTAFLSALSEIQVNLFAVDEAHCISQWGHDFRPDYSLLGAVRKKLRPPRTIALTATATPEVREDITRSLLMKDPEVLVAGFDRANLFLEVLPVSGDEERRRACVELAGDGDSGIIYCATRKAADGMQRALAERGLRAILYHAGLDDEARHRAQEKFMSSERSVVVATNAFGMGIDKADIRFVVHAQIPRAVEAYYQEIGRAGRDGRDSRAVLLFNHADVFTQERLIQGSHPTESVFADVWSALQSVEQFENGVSALAGQISASEFEVSAALRILERESKIARSGRGEGRHRIHLLPKAPQARPQAEDAKKLLAQMLAEHGLQRSFAAELRQIARGAGLTEAQAHHALSLLEKSGAVKVHRPFSGRILRALERVPFHQLGLDLTRLRAQEQRSMLLLRRMTDYAYARRCRRAFILRYFGESQVRSQCGTCDVCAGPRLRREARSKVGTAMQAPSHNDLAASELRRWRRELSRELNIPAFIIFNDATLLALATALPTNRPSFLAVKGTGATRWERFGPKVIEICSLARAAAGGPASPQASARQWSS